MTGRDVTAAEMEVAMAQAFHREPGQWAVDALKGQHGGMDLQEADDVIRAAAFGRETDRTRIAEANQVLEEVSASTPGTTRGITAQHVQESVDAPMNDLLDRVASKPGGRTRGFTEDHDRRMDAAFATLRELAESRLGMPKLHAESHARRAFLEMQHTAATQNETKESFVRRLEQRVAGYRAMSPLVVD